MIFKKKKNIKDELKSFGHSTIIPGNAQHIGSREEQQDAFGFSDFFDKELVDNAGVLAVLADGMGGLNQGKLASTTVVKTMIDIFSNKALSEKIIDLLHRSIRIINKKVLNISDIKGYTGTTLICAIIFKNQLHWISVGDSRIYHFRNGELIKLNVEHNYGNELDELFENGKISEHEALESDKRHMLTSYIGIPHLEKIDFSETPINIENDDLILLCSDGLFNTLTEEEIISKLKENITNPQSVAEELVKDTIDKNMEYQDNVTLVILRNVINEN